MIIDKDDTVLEREGNSVVQEEQALCLCRAGYFLQRDEEI